MHNTDKYVRAEALWWVHLILHTFVKRTPYLGLRYHDCSKAMPEFHLFQIQFSDMVFSVQKNKAQSLIAHIAISSTVHETLFFLQAFHDLL